MLINEITSSEDQLNLLKLISNCTWSAIQQQNTDAVNQAKKIKPKKGKPKQFKLKVPPPPPILYMYSNGPIEAFEMSSRIHPMRIYK